MKKIFIAISAIVVVLYLSGCRLYKTENGIVLGLPNYEKRDIKVSANDLKILKKADALLSNQNIWRQEKVSNCNESTKLDLYCALEQATISVMGKYIHRQPALQEVRFAIDDNYKDRWEKHRLIDFNANSKTRFEDVKNVLALAIKAVENKLKTNQESSPR